MNRDTQIYKAYISAQQRGETTVEEVARRFGISRYAVYQAVNRVRNGDVTAINRCLEKSRLDCLWKYRYQPRVSVLPENKEDAEEELRVIINQMHDEGFTVVDIANRLGRHRQYVYNRLKK